MGVLMGSPHQDRLARPLGGYAEGSVLGRVLLNDFEQQAEGDSVRLDNSEGTRVDIDHLRRLEMLDKLLNDPDTPLNPRAVWLLAAEIAAAERARTTVNTTPNE
jgi:hypothetical protein